MEKSRVITFVLILFMSAFIFQSCSKDDDDDTTDPNPEFVADDNTFKDFMNWALEATHQGADPALGMAHGGNDSTVVREVYFKDGQDMQNGSYPIGTVIVKHSHNPDNSVNEFTAMAKRGNNFSPNGGDWEWFMLNSDGSIATDGDGNPMRGANLMDGMCLSCHSQAAGSDYVFSK
ncbi:MAG: cytochrome P460 family protein [Bacteroidales bacterium]|nr:cytochrome P460 family protein [Bacteroidales bacterium]MCF8397905.1 cytochrome P460 family protein [Bacteroidales bacterium]